MTQRQDAASTTLAIYLRIYTFELVANIPTVLYRNRFNKPTYSWGPLGKRCRWRLAALGREIRAKWGVRPGRPPRSRSTEVGGGGGGDGGGDGGVGGQGTCCSSRNLPADLPACCPRLPVAARQGCWSFWGGTRMDRHTWCIWKLNNSLVFILCSLSSRNSWRNSIRNFKISGIFFQGKIGNFMFF